MNENNKKTSGPEQQYKISNCQVAIWSNVINKNDQVMNLRTLSINKSYKDKDGNWKQTATFLPNEIPKLVLALNKAYEYLYSDQKIDDTSIPEEIVS